MRKMRFDNEIAWKQLSEIGKVATMRNYPYQVFKNVIAYHNHKFEEDYGWIRARIIDEAPTNDINISWYSQWCGFKNAIVWREEAIKLHKGLPKHIYLVEKFDWQNLNSLPTMKDSVSTEAKE
jgi:hypothetical protein